MPELNDREKQILYAAITEFVTSGEPVGSRTLAKNRGIDLSPASIRNVLSDLEEKGYLHQPHTSAGRIPTDRAFRLFIDALMEVKELSEMDHAKIRERFEALSPGPNMLRETGRLLSDLTGTAAIVRAPKVETLTLRNLRFVPTSPGELLAVLVFTNGSVSNRFLRVAIAENELGRVHNLLDDVVDGRSLGELRDLFARRLASERVQNDQLRKKAFELGDAAIQGAYTGDTDVVIEGQAKLFSQPEFASPENARALALLLEEREQILQLLDATLEAKGATVAFGSEGGLVRGDDDAHLALIAAPYADHGRNTGSIGVIGPTRMNYPKVVPIVAATATAMTQYMDRTGEKKQEEDNGEDD
jgi:heat-inducible transcriptional repressor